MAQRTQGMDVREIANVHGTQCMALHAG